MDSFFNVISQNAQIKTILNDANNIYKNARIDEANVSLNAFRIAYLEKEMLDSGLLIGISTKLYKKQIFLRL